MPNFVTVDVFTDRRFGGNPLAVVIDADGLTPAEMQAIAAEFNLAETTFILPPEDLAHTAKVRIFTPKSEMPFAGHPNVGTAFVLAHELECYGRRIPGDTMLFEEGAGLVRMTLLTREHAVVGARLAAPQPLAIGEAISPETVAEACGLAAADIETRHHRPCIASCGLPLLFAELKERAALAAARPRAEVFERRLPRDRITGLHLYVRTAERGLDIQARMFAPLYGVPEDPATGSANVALVGLLAHLRPEPELSLALSIGQGFDMGRPSRMSALAEKKGGTVTQTYIGGNCVMMMRGFLDLD